MNLNFFAQISKQLLVLTSILGIGTISVAPALADNPTEMDESVTEIETEMDESTTEMETEMDESATEMETEVDESATEMETEVDESATEIETEMDESATEMETEVDESATEMETEMDESATEMETEVDETTTEMETEVDESTTEMETEVDETTTEMETEVDESTTEMETEMDEPTAEAGNIVEVASGNESFSTLVKAVEAAGLGDTLSDSSASYTVFAPTDEAFNQLPEGTLDYLLQPENQEVLQQVLSYHVVPDKVMSTDISGGTVDSLAGGLATAATDMGVVINNASVLDADIEASNGIIHSVNRVLLPADLQSTLASELGIEEDNIYQ